MFGSARTAAAPPRRSRRSPSRACRPGSRGSPRAGGARASAARVSSVELGSSSPAASHASAQRMPRPPAFVSTATRRPRGSGWRESSDGGVERAPRACRRAARPPGGRARRPRRPSRRARRCASRPPSARRSVVPPFIARIGFRRATRPRDARELARVAERLEVEQDEVGLRVVLPPLEQVVRRDVGLVADRDERREAEPARARRFSSSARPSAPLCDEKPIRPAGRRAARRSRSGRRAAEAMPRQFGPTSRAPCARTSASSCSWRSRPSAPVSAKPAEITQSARTPFAAPPRPRRARARRAGR